MADTSGTIHTVSEGGIAADHIEVPLPPAIVAATHSGEEHNTLKQSIIPFACWRASDIRFKFESSFVLPEVAAELKALKKLIDDHTLSDEQGTPPRKPALTVFGHADPTGKDDFNKALSGRRARAIYGMLTRKTDLWEELFEDRSDKWGDEALGTMLDTVSSGSSPPPSGTKAPPSESGTSGAGQPGTGRDSAIDQEREKQLQKLANNPGERKKLYKSYMDAVCASEVFRLEAADQVRLQNQGVAVAGRLTGLLGQEFAEDEDFLHAAGIMAGIDEVTNNDQTLLREARKAKPFTVEPEDFLASGKDKGGKGDYQGCGEFNPIFLQSQEDIDRFDKLPDSSPEKPILKAVRDAANEPNRRVLIFLFRPGVHISPDVWPCPRDKEGTEGCKKRFFSDADVRRNSRLPNQPRKFQDTQNTFACRFYDRLSNKSPCERVLENVEIRLYDSKAEFIKFAPFEILLQKTSTDDGNDKPTKIAGKANERGVLRLKHIEIPATCQISWGFPPPPGEEPFFEFSLAIVLDLNAEKADEEAKQRLNNLGYPSGNPLAVNIKLFQKDCGQLADPPVKEGASVEETLPLLRNVHRGCTNKLHKQLGEE